MCEDMVTADGVTGKSFGGVVLSSVELLELECRAFDDGIWDGRRTFRDVKGND